jgi:hypothetical protein
MGARGERIFGILSGVKRLLLFDFGLAVMLFRQRLVDYNVVSNKVLSLQSRVGDSLFSRCLGTLVFWSPLVFMDDMWLVVCWISSMVTVDHSVVFNKYCFRILVTD